MPGILKGLCLSINVDLTSYCPTEIVVGNSVGGKEPRNQKAKSRRLLRQKEKATRGVVAKHFLMLLPWPFLGLPWPLGSCARDPLPFPDSTAG